MTAHRIRTGVAIGLLGMALSTGTAAAQVAGCSFSDCTPQQPEVPEGELGTGEVVGKPEAAPPGVLGEELSAGGPAQAEAPSGSLPVTGGDVLALTAMGGAAIVGGTLLVKRTKKA